MGQCIERRERNKQIYLDRCEGLSCVELSLKYNISKSRISQIYSDYQKNIDRENDHLFKFCKRSSHQYSALKNAGITSPEALLEYSSHTNRRPRNIGEVNYESLVNKAKQFYHK